MLVSSAPHEKRTIQVSELNHELELVNAKPLPADHPQDSHTAQLEGACRLQQRSAVTGVNVWVVLPERVIEIRIINVQGGGSVIVACDQQVEEMDQGLLSLI